MEESLTRADSFFMSISLPKSSYLKEKCDVLLMIRLGLVCGFTKIRIYLIHKQKNLFFVHLSLGRTF